MANCPYGCGVDHRYGPKPTNCKNYPRRGVSSPGAGGASAPSSLGTKSVLGQASGGSLAEQRDRDAKEVKVWMKDNAREIDAELCTHPDWDEKKDDLREAAQYVATLKHPEASARNIRSGSMSTAGLAEMAFEHHHEQEGYRAQAAEACKDHDIDDLVGEAAYDFGVEDNEEVRRQFDKNLHYDAGAFLDDVESYGAENAIRSYAETAAEEVHDDNAAREHQRRERTRTPSKAEMQEHKFNSGHYKDRD